MAVRKKHDGWEVYYRDPVTGKQRSRFFKTQKDAEKEDRRVKYMLEFEREKIIEEDAKRTPVPKPKPKPKPEPESKPALDPDRYLFKNVVKTFEEWRGRVLSSQERYAIKKFLQVDVRTVTRQTLSSYYLECIRLGNKPQTTQTPDRLDTPALRLPAHPKRHYQALPGSYRGSHRARSEQSTLRPALSVVQHHRGTGSEMPQWRLLSRSHLRFHLPNQTFIHPRSSSNTLEILCCGLHRGTPLQ